MNRSGYTDDFCDDNWALIRWRGAVASAIRGKRGQAFLRELLAALDAMPEKRLGANALREDATGDYCALGALGAARGMDIESITPDDRSDVADAFGVAEALAAEIMYENDEAVAPYQYRTVVVVGPMRPWESHIKTESFRDPREAERRFAWMHTWVRSHIRGDL